MIRKPVATFIAAILACGASPPQATAKISMSEFAAICADTDGDPNRMKEAALALGYTSPLLPVAPNTLLYLVKNVDGERRSLDVRRQGVSSSEGVPAQTMTVCTISADDADGEDADAARRWISSIEGQIQDQPQPTALAYLARGDQRIALLDTRGPAIAEALRDGGYKVVRVYRIGGETYVTLYRMTLVKQDPP